MLIFCKGEMATDRSVNGPKCQPTETYSAFRTLDTTIIKDCQGIIWQLNNIKYSISRHYECFNWSKCCSVSPSRSSNGPKTFFRLIWQKKNIYFSCLVSTERNVGQSQLVEVATDRNFYWLIWQKKKILLVTTNRNVGQSQRVEVATGRKPFSGSSNRKIHIFV